MIYLKMENAVTMSSFKILTPPVSHKETHMPSCAHINQKNENYAEQSILNICVPTRSMVLLCFSERNQTQGGLCFLSYELNLCNIYISNR